MKYAKQLIHWFTRPRDPRSLRVWAYAILLASGWGLGWFLYRLLRVTWEGIWE